MIRPLVLVFLSITLFTCKVNDDDQGMVSCTGDFDLQSILENVADNIIIPNYETLKRDLEELDREMIEFEEEVRASTLMHVRGTYFACYLTWQKLAQYEFGPAEAVFLRSTMNNFPLNVEETQQAILLGFEESKPDQYISGFPALDYLLYGVGENQVELLDFYINDPNAELYLTYAKAIISEMNLKIGEVLDEWQSQYRDQFVQNTGTGPGSSLSILINELNQNYDLIAMEKLGVPSGALNLDDAPNPEKAEALFSDEGLTMAFTALIASRDLYFGTSADGKEGIGLSELLRYVHAKKGDQLLDDVIKQQFAESLNLLEELAWQAPMSEIIESNQSALIEAYNSVVAQLVNIKTDMPAVLCI